MAQLEIYLGMDAYSRAKKIYTTEDTIVFTIVYNKKKRISLCLPMSTHRTQLLISGKWPVDSFGTTLQSRGLSFTT